jgi:hypothetical protein
LLFDPKSTSSRVIELLFAPYLPNLGSVVQSLTHWNQSIFESDESTWDSEFPLGSLQLAANSTPQSTKKTHHQ